MTRSIFCWCILFVFVANVTFAQNRLRDRWQDRTPLFDNIVGNVGEQPPQTEFVFNLYRTVVKDKTEDDANTNVAVSPYGVQKILDLTRFGAVGETRTEIERVLGYSRSFRWESSSDGTLSTAAALWTQRGYSLQPAFLQTARQNFGSSVEPLDFANNPEAAVRRINAWCSEQTRGKIPEILADLDTMTRLVLANAVYFAADWKEPFDPSYTGDFTLQDGTKMQTDLMWQFDDMRYGETVDTLILELPYKEPGRERLLGQRLRDNRPSTYSMLLLLPKDPAEFAKWESAMTLQKWNALRRTIRMELVDMRMPKFTMESDIDLKEPLMQLGMTTAFDAGNADFSRINGRRDLFVGQALQKTFVKVDETGTEAAAVTAVAIAMSAAPDEDPVPPKEFYADRPFLYAIVKGDTILFLGRFVKPDGE